MSIQQICRVKYCDRNVQSLRLCQNHYKSYRKYGDALYVDSKRLASKSAVCMVSGCSRPVRVKSMCRMHYSREAYTGSATNNTRKDPRPSIADGLTAKIPLGLDAKYGYAVVDVDMAWLDKYKWNVNHRGYATSKVQYDGIKKTVFMHRLILGTRSGMQTDHINGDRLDNRKSNLRQAMSYQNAANKIHKGKSYRGVEKVGNKYASRVAHRGTRYYKGGFSTPEEAAMEYNRKSIELNGEFATLNVIGDKE